MFDALTIDWDYFVSPIPTNTLYNCHYMFEEWKKKGCKQSLKKKAVKAFWKKIQSALDLSQAECLVCENHVAAGWYFDDCQNLLNFDYHYDGRPSRFEGYLTSGSWITRLGDDHVTTVHPDEGNHSPELLANPKHEIRKILICRSSPWVHPKYDKDFFKFADRCPCNELLWEKSLVPRSSDSGDFPKEHPEDMESYMIRENSQPIIELFDGKLLLL